MSFSIRSVCFRSLSALLVAVTACGCLAYAADADDATKATEKADEALPEPGIPLLKAEPAADAGPKVDPFVVPEGDAAALLTYIKKLRTLRPEGRDMPTVRDFVGKLSRALTEAADKILAGQATKEQKMEAGSAKFGALALRAQLGDAAASAAIEALPEQFLKLGLPELARDARAVVLQMQLEAAVTGQPGAKTLEQVTDAIKKMVAENPVRETLSLAFDVVTQWEQQGKTEQVVALCDEFAKIYAKGTDPSIVQFVKTLEGIGRRMKLIGNPMQVQGTMLDGKPLDMAKYKGKVVLVMFWSTTCEPCVAEFANLEKLYKLYHDRGFDVIAISLDESRAALDGFLAKSKLPGTVLFDNGEGPTKLKHPTAMSYSVIYTPTMIMIGADGKVATLDAHGPRLEETLAKLLGPAEKKAEAKTPAAKPAS